MRSCVCLYVRQRQSECLCIWASGGGRAIICFKLLAGRGEVGETVLQKESKEGESKGGGRVRTGKEEMSWQVRSNTERIKKKQGERSRSKVRVFWICMSYGCSTATVPLSSLLAPRPPIVTQGSMSASKAANSSDIYTAFSSF